MYTIYKYVNKKERKSLMKKILSVVTAMVMIFCIFPPIRPFAAETISAVRYILDSKNSLTKINEDLVAEKIDSTLINWDNNNYYVDKTVEISDRIEVKGDVYLILTDGCSLTAKKGIHVAAGNSLTIYGQEKGTGTLTAEFYAEENDYSYDAAIGGNDKESAGDIELHGGIISIPCSEEAKSWMWGAAIGGGFQGNGGKVTVYNGTIDISTPRMSSAGIGGGFRGNGGTVRIYGGNITANNGIGGGDDGTNSDLYIYGGKVGGTPQRRDQSGGTVTVKGGEYTITGLANAEASLIADRVIVDGGTLIAEGSKNGIKASEVMLYSGTLTAGGVSRGIDANSIAIRGGRLNAYVTQGSGALSSEPLFDPHSDLSVFAGSYPNLIYHADASDYGEKYFYVEEGSRYKVTFDYGNGTVKTYTIPLSGKITRPQNPTSADGKAFNGWYNGDELADFSAVYNDNVTFTAKWGEYAAVDYVDYVVNGAGNRPQFIDKKAYIAVPPLASSDTDFVLDQPGVSNDYYNGVGYDGWCYVKGDVVIDGDLIVTASSAILMIITDGSSLTVNGRIISSGNFIVYAQRGGTGKLIVNADSTEPAVSNMFMAGGDVKITNRNGPATSGAIRIYGGSLTAESQTGPAIRYQADSLVFLQGKLIAKSGTGKALDFPEDKIKFWDNSISYDIYTSSSPNGSGKAKLADISQLYTVLENSAYAEFKPIFCDHSGNINPTCEGANCLVCGEYINPTGHKNGDPVIENETEAVCEIGGSYDDVIYCSVCGKELSRETKTVEAKGHIPAEPVIENQTAAVCTEGGSYDEVVYCSVCKKELSRVTKTTEALGHIEGEWEVISAPTTTSVGTRVIKCKVCGEILKTETIPQIIINIPQIPANIPTEKPSEVVYTEFPELNFSIEIKDGKAIISWDKVENVNKYVVYAIRDGKLTELEKTKKTEFETKHTSGTCYLVRYMKNGVLSPKSKSMNEDITSDKPMVTAISDKNSVTLRWQDMGAEKYNIYKYVDGKAVKIGSVNGASVKIKNLYADTEYKFIVTAVIDGKETAMIKSDIVTVRTKKI